MQFSPQALIARLLSSSRIVCFHHAYATQKLNRERICMTGKIRRSRSQTVGAVLWLCCFQFFVAEQIAMSAWKLPYSMSRNYISDLGEVHCTTIECSPLHALMNSSFVLQGMLIFIGAILVRKLFPTNLLSQLALFFIMLSGVGVFLVGVAPEDAYATVHYAGAAEHFLLNTIGMALLGVVVIFRSRRPYGLYTLMSGLIGLAGTILLSRKIFLGLGAGGMERVASYPFPLWLTVTGAVLMLMPNGFRSVPSEAGAGW